MTTEPLYLQSHLKVSFDIIGCVDPYSLMEPNFEFTSSLSEILGLGVYFELIQQSSLYGRGRQPLSPPVSWVTSNVPARWFEFGSV